MISQFAELNTPKSDAVNLWLNQFDRVDLGDAKRILSAIRNVSADEFHREMTDLIRSRVSAEPSPVGLFVEAEVGDVREKAPRLFKESNQKPRRATGSRPSLANPKNEVGSEGLVAQITSGVFRENRRRAILRPGPDKIRQHKVRRLILVTDFVGSGNRICRYLDAAWRVCSVRSWWSARRTKGISFEVIAFSITKEGRELIEAHPCGPYLKTVEGCPTIDEVFEIPKMRRRIKELCTRYGSFDKSFDPLGYGGTGALITFAHGMPNNAPVIFHRKSNLKDKPWKPLYPQRVTSGRRMGLGSIAEQNSKLEFDWLQITKQKVLGSPRFVSAPMVLQDAVQVLLAMDRTPRDEATISARTGLSVERVREAIRRIDIYGWVDDKYRIVEKGRRELARLRVPVRSEVQFESSNIYTPPSLRAPREV